MKPGQYLLNFFILVALLSLVFSLRAVSSVSIALIFITGLTLKRPAQALPMRTASLLLVPASVFLLLKLVSVVFSGNQEEALKHLEKSSAILVIPLALYSIAPFLDKNRYRLFMRLFLCFLAVSLVYCLIIAASRFFHDGSSTHFFYHDLAGAVGQHAIRYSALVLIGVIYLLFSPAERLPFIFQTALLLFFSAFLVLLSSKLVLLYFIILLGYYFIERRRFEKKKLLTVIAGLFIGLFITAFAFQPVRQRFYLLAGGDPGLFMKDHFNQGTYFNGVQFRLLQWRLTAEILNEEKAWMTGVTTGDARELLNKKYVDKDMYTGDQRSGDRGLLDYHTHNQFLQTTLQQGVSGLMLLCLMSIALILMSKWSGTRETGLIVLFLLLYCFTDAVFETQYGLFIFFFFPLLSYLSFRTGPITVGGNQG